VDAPYLIGAIPVIPLSPPHLLDVCFGFVLLVLLLLLLLFFLFCYGVVFYLFVFMRNIFVYFFAPHSLCLLCQIGNGVARQCKNKEILILLRLRLLLFFTPTTRTTMYGSHNKFSKF